jgi:hypothetical protein
VSLHLANDTFLRNRLLFKGEQPGIACPACKPPCMCRLANCTESPVAFALLACRHRQAETGAACVPLQWLQRAC